jgi:transposase
MGRGKDLSDYTKGQIDAFHAEGLSERDIAERVGRSKSAVHQQINKDPNYIPEKRGRKRKLSERDDRAIIRAVSNKRTSSRRIKHELRLDVSSRTIRRVLHKCPYLSYDKMRRGPWSNPRIKRERYEWSIAVLHMGPRWQQVIFSDEKKFNLDGPDGLNYYWHDNRKDKIRFSKRQQGGGGIMFWGGIGRFGLTPLVKVDGRLNSILYQRLLTNYLLPVGNQIGGNGWVFQQDGASCHRSRSTLGWFDRRNIELLDWPPYSPDMNIIENLWGQMVREVYPDGKQYLTLESLETAVREAWARFEPQHIVNLFNSIPRRVTELEVNHGGPTSY